MAVDTAIQDPPLQTAPPQVPPTPPPGGPGGQAPAVPPTKQLYDKLSQGGLYTKSFDDFQKKYSTPEAINDLYTKLSQAQLFTKDKDAFVDKYFPSPKLPGQDMYQYPQDQQQPGIPAQGTPDFMQTGPQAAANQTMPARQQLMASAAQSAQELQQHRSQNEAATLQSMGQDAMKKDIAYKVDQAMSLFPKAATTGVKRPNSPIQQQATSDTDPATTRLPEVVQPIVDQYTDPETGYASSFKINEANDPTGAATRTLFHEMAARNPAIAKNIQKNVYLLDAQRRPENAAKILSNASAIDNGDLVYDVKSGQLGKPEGFFDHMATEFAKRGDDMDAAKTYINGSRSEILNRLEMAYAKHDPDEPVGVAKDWGGELGGTIGGQGPNLAAGLVAGTIGTVGGGLVGNPELGPILAAAVTTPEFMDRSYKNSLEQNFIKNRQAGMNMDQAYDQAAPVATRTSALDGAQAAAMAVVGSKLGFTETPGSPGPVAGAPASYLAAATKLLRKIPTFAKDVGTESAAMGTLGAAVQGLKNINEGRPQNEGTGEAFYGTAAFTAVMGALAKGIGTAVSSAKDFNDLRRGAAKAPQAAIDQALAENLKMGVITPDEALRGRLLIKDQKVADAALPDLDEATQQKVQNLIEKRDIQQKLMDDPTNAKYKTEFKNSIADLNEQIETLKGKPKPEEQIKAAQDLIAEDKIPGTAGEITKAVAGDPEKLQAHLKEIAEQSYDPASAEHTKETYGGLVKIAQEMYPMEELPHVENAHSMTVDEEKPVAQEPEAKTIFPDDRYRTINYGDLAKGGVPETAMAKAQVAKDIEAGDVKLGETGETFNQFKPRVIEPFQEDLATQPKDTTIVTHSSVLKAMKVWDDMGRPDINKLTPEQSKDFADRYNDEQATPAELVSFDKVQGDPSQGQIHVVRHGETNSNEDGNFRTNDDNLTADGEREAAQAGAKIKDLVDGGKVPQIITSDLPRTIHTSNIIHEVLTGKRVDPRATEISNEVHPDQAADALQGSYDRLLEGNAKADDPDMVRMKEQIDHLKNNSHAISEQKTTGLDVRQQTQNGPSVGVGDTEHTEPAGASAGTSQQRTAANRGPKAAPEGKAQNEKEGGSNPPPNGPEQVRQTMEAAPNPVTGIQNVITAEKIAEMGLEPFEEEAAREWGPVWAKAKQKYMNGFDIQRLIEQKEANPGSGLTDEEAALLTLHAVRKEAEFESAVDTINRSAAEGNLKELAEAKIALASTKDELQRLYDVTKDVGREQARGFNARKMLSDRKYSLVRMLQNAKAANDGEELTPEEEENVRQQFEDIKKKNAAYEARIAELEEENRQLKADQAVKDAGKNKPKTPKTHDEYVAERQKLLEDIREKLRKSRGEAGAAIVPYAKELFEIAPEVGKLIRSLVEEGIDKLPDLIDHVHDTLTDVIDGITKKDVRDLIAGEYRDPAKDLTPEQQKLKDLKMQASLINKLEALQKGEKSEAAKKNPAKYSKEVEDLRSQIAELEKQNKEAAKQAAGPTAKKPRSEASRLASMKKSLKAQIDDLENRVNTQNFAPAAKPAIKPIVLDEEAIKLKADLERARDKYQASLRKFQQRNLSTWQKFLGGFVKVERAEKLSSPITVGKLGSAAFTRLVMTPAEDVLGGAAQAVLPKSIKSKALGEIGFNATALAKGYKKAITQGMKDSYMNLKNQKSDLEATFGRKGDLPSTALDYLGQVHAATKAPVKRFMFERSLQKQLNNAVKYNVDASDPLVMASIVNRAYKDSQRAIFMQDNAVADYWTKKMTTVNPAGKHVELGQVRAAAAKWLIPFVKIPTNIIGEIGSNVGGLEYAVAKIGHVAFTKGLENMTEDEAASVVRNLKKGIIGNAALLLGYFQAENFGGFYQKGKKQKDDEPGFMGARIFGENVPAWMMESPIFQTMQLGATVRKLSDTYVKKDKATMGVWKASGHALLGLAEEEPLLEAPGQLFSAITNDRDRMYYLGELAKSTIDPAILNNVASWTDSADKRSFLEKLEKSENLRKPSTIMQHIESGAPYFREDVPLKTDKKHARITHSE